MFWPGSSLSGKTLIQPMRMLAVPAVNALGSPSSARISLAWFSSSLVSVRRYDHTRLRRVSSAGVVLVSAALRSLAIIAARASSDVDTGCCAVVGAGLAGGVCFVSCNPGGRVSPKGSSLVGPLARPRVSCRA